LLERDSKQLLERNSKKPLDLAVRAPPHVNIVRLILRETNRESKDEAGNSRRKKSLGRQQN
jgi:hypothetical protein